MDPTSNLHKIDYNCSQFCTFGEIPGFSCDHPFGGNLSYVQPILYGLHLPH